MDNTIILQGSFTQGTTATAQTIQLRSDVDWMRIYNYTQMANGTGAGQGIEYYWQRGMAQGTGLAWNKEATIEASVGTVLAAPNGFYLIDSSQQALGALNNGSTGISDISAANPPVVTVGSTAGMSAGTVVRLFNMVGAQQLAGLDFTVGNGTLSGTTFSLDYMPAIAAAAAPGTGASFRVVPFNPIFYPRTRYITKITQAAQCVVSLSVTHQYSVGQQVRVIVPNAYGMTQINGLQATIVAVNTAATAVTGNTITLDIDTTGFTAFAFPATAAFPFSAAMIVPIGEDTSFALSAGVDILTDATLNTAYIGMYLPAGANSPGGAANDVIYWTAGKSFSNNGQ